MSGVNPSAAIPAFDPGAFGKALLDSGLPVPDSIDTQAGASRNERFAVYRNNVVQGLIAALETRFAMVRRVVGADFFANAARLYAIQNPPRLPMMSFYGEDFANFLAAFEPCAELPYLADLARLEAARTRAYHAADAAPLAPDAFASLAPTDLMRLRVRLHPSFFSFASAYPVATIFAMNNDELPLAEITDWRSEDVVIARPHMRVEIHCLTQGGAAFLNGLAQGATLSEAAGKAFAAAPDFELAAALAGLIGFGLAVEIVLEPISISS
jgi:hypothetical protein